MCGPHSQAPHVHSDPPLWTSSHVGCTQNCNPICSRIWQHDPNGLSGTNPCGWLAGMLTVSAAESKNWITFWDSTASTYACWPRHASGQGKSSGWQTVCHRSDRLTEGGGTAILVRRGVVHHAVHVQGLQHLEATAIQVMLATKPVKVLAAYLSPTRPLIA